MDFVTTYHDALEAFVALTGAPRSLLQVHAGMAIYLACQLLLGTRRGSLAAVLIAVLLAVFHEMMNRLYYGTWFWHETTRDLVLVLFWPTACYAVSCLRRWHHAERVRQRANDRLLHLYDYRPEQPRRPSPDPAPDPAGDFALGRANRHAG